MAKDKVKETPKQQPSTSLAPRPAATPATRGSDDVPDYLQVHGRAPEGGELVNQTDITVPRLALCQSMTPQRKKSDPKFIPGLEEGMYFNNVSGKIYGEKVKFVPVFFYRSRIRFFPLDDGGGIRCQAMDGKTGFGDPGGNCLKCQFAQFDEGEAPECTEFKNFAGIIVPEKGLPALEDAIVSSFKSTGLKAAKTLNSLIRMRGLDYYASIFELSSAVQKNDKGTFYVPVVSFATERTDCSTPDKTKPASFVSREMYEIGVQVCKGMKALQAQGQLRVVLEDEPREPGDEPRGTTATANAAGM